LRRLLFIIILFLLSDIAYSQASLVPVYHQVYDWLHYQRVRGNAPLYKYEALPLTRGQLTQLLSDINPGTLNRGDQHVRESYLREFSVDSLKNYNDKSLIQGEGRVYNRLADIVFSDDEPHVYVWDSRKATIAFDWFPGRGAATVKDGDLSYTSPYYTYGGIRTYGTIFNNFGFHFEQWRAVHVGDTEVFDYIPFMSRNAKYLRSGRKTENKHHLENFFGASYDFVNLHIGRGTPKYGVGSRNNLVFSRESIPFDWVRLNINSKYIKFTSVYGQLSWEPDQKNQPLDGYENQYTRTSPERWVVHQRIQLQPASWISFGFYELNVISNRDLELSFINPVNNLSIMEWEHYDKGNGFAGFEGVLRPFKGLELYGELLVDDLGDSKDIFKWGKKTASNSKLGRYLGISYAANTGSVLTVDYQRIEPGVYTHKFILNTYSEKGFSLGSQLGPNADELSFTFDQWLSHRFRLNFRYDYGRHGMNFIDDSGEFVDAGGDLFDSYKLDDNLRPSRPDIFLGGDLHRWNRYTAKLSYSPWRGITINAEYSLRSMLQGEQMTDLSFFNFTFLVGY
jgi:hypothetical protein